MAEGITLLEGDCLELMKKIPDKSIGMILCDLPYGTIECSWDVIIPFDKLWDQYKRIIDKNGAIVLTSSQPFTTKLISSNIDMFKYCWVWEKTKAPDFVNAKNKPLKEHEDIVVFSFGNTANGTKNKMKYYPQGLVLSNKKVSGKTLETKFGNIAGKRDSHLKEYISEYTNYPRSILKFPNETNTIHPTQKPVSLFEYLIKTYTLEGETVLDNTAGSMTTAIAAINTNRKCICMEKDPVMFAKARQRVENHVREVESIKAASLFDYFT